MPSRSVKKNYIINYNSESSSPFTMCDFILLLAIFSIFSYISYGAYGEIIEMTNKLEEKSIHCLKDFHDSNCNPFNLTSTCEGLNKCIKNGDDFMDPWEILEVVNHKIKGNGALPLVGLILGITAEIRRRLRQRHKED